MSVVERLKSTRQYIGEVASKSVGVGMYREYKQVDNIKKQLGEPKTPQIEKVMVTVFYALTPATILALLEKDSSSEPKKIQSKFKTGAKVLGALGVDLSTLIIPIAASTAAQESLPLLGLLGKPLGNAAVYVASDVMNARAFKRKDLPKATPGTYDLLQEAYDKSYDTDLKIGVVKDLQGAVKAVLRKEEICAESGGSCMVLIVPMIDDEGRNMGYEYAHVTDKDVIANIGASTGGQRDKDIRPNIEELIVNLKKPEPTV